MFESDIERSKIRLLELVNSTQPTVYLNDILGRASIDYAYKQFFEAEFGWWLYEEQTLRQTNPNLDLNDPATAGILNNLDTQYRKHARFDREQLMLIIDSAVKCVLNYRVRPRTTLKWFVFRGEPTKPIYEVYLRMRYFADYRYLHEGFNQWLLKRGLRYDSLDIISVLEFERLIKKIDDDTILELSPNQFVDLISPINYFFAELAADPTVQSIPIEAVIIFLDDKEVYIIAQKLERMLYQQGIRHLTKEMFLSVVDEVLSELEPEHDDDDSADRAESAAFAEPEGGPARQRSSASELIRPTGSADTESILRAGMSAASASNALAASEAALKAMMSTRSGGDSASHVSVIEELSRRIDEKSEHKDATEQSLEDAPSSVAASDNDKSDSADSAQELSTQSVVSANAPEQLPSEKPDSSLFIKEESAQPGVASAFVIQEDKQIESDVNANESTNPVADNLRNAPAQNDTQDLQSAVAASKASSAAEDMQQTSVVASEPALSASPDSARDTVAETDTEDMSASSSSSVSAQPVNTSSSTPLSKEASSDVGSLSSRAAVAAHVLDPNNPPTLEVIARALGTETESTEQSPRSPYFENATSNADQSVGSQAESKVFPSMTSFYDERQQDNYIRKLCGKDAEKFAELVASIDQTRNWKEALAFLDKFYSQQGIDPNASVARDFRMAVYKRFIAI